MHRFIIFKSIFSQFNIFLIWQCNALIYALDPLANDKFFPLQTSSNFLSLDFTFLLPFLFFIISALYGNVYLVYEKYGYFNQATFNECPFLINHQMFPRSMWPQSDFLWLIAELGTAFGLAIFLKVPLASFDRYEEVNKLKHQVPILTICKKGIIELKN